MFWVNEKPYDVFDGKSDEMLVNLHSIPMPDQTSLLPSTNAEDTDLSRRDRTVRENTIIYEEPTGTSKRLARLGEGEVVHVVAKAGGDFWEVEHAELRGFVHDLLLKEPVSENATPHESGGLGDGAYRMEDGITPPKLVSHVAPSYTDDALARRVEGTVILEVVILATGKIGPLRVIHGLSNGLTEKAIECVRQWVFVPGKLNGQIVDVVAEIEVNFSIVDKPK